MPICKERASRLPPPIITGCNFKIKKRSYIYFNQSYKLHWMSTLTANYFFHLSSFSRSLCFLFSLGLALLTKAHTSSSFHFTSIPLVIPPLRQGYTARAQLLKTTVVHVLVPTVPPPPSATTSVSVIFSLLSFYLCEPPFLVL